MEYFLGSLTTFLLMIFTSFFIKKNEDKNKIKKIKVSQSYTYIVLKNLLRHAHKPPHKNQTQASKHDEKTNIKVILSGKHAYWIKDNSFYVANIGPDGIDGESAQIVDTMGMDRVQLDKMLLIIDQLRDGKRNDSGDSGNTEVQ